MNTSFHIGRLAELSGRSEHTIRWYERQGLIPNVGRDRGGRRVYEDGHVEHLMFLEWLRLTGMSVDEMRQFTELSMRGWRTIGQRQDMLKAHRKDVEARIKDLRVALSLIDAKMEYFAEWAARKKRPPPVPLPELAQAHTKARTGKRSRNKAQSAARD